MIVSVTEQDIAGGFRSDAGGCPVARAMNRISRERGWRTRGWGFDGHWLKAALALPKGDIDFGYVVPPSGVEERARVFDETGEMEPFAFFLDDAVFSWATGTEEE